MSKPADGKYYIVSTQTASDGSLLAATYSGENSVVTVRELGTQPTQVWVLTSYDSTKQFVSPRDSTSLQVNFGTGNGLLVLPANGTFWAISGSNGVYTIKGSANNNVWFIKEAKVGQPVYGGTGGQLPNWKLIPA
ncbi:hypothetical protein OG21DRAFT_1491558 [Imleria badia]|nr:hypothetical protein OG21DRAFT_1491558 [Imleria badia]